MKVFIPNRFIDQLAYYEEILKAIESYNSFKDCYIFLHFSIPGSREVDMVVITTNSMKLIEIKKEIF